MLDLSGIDLKSLGRSELLDISYLIKEAQSLVDFNEYNRLRNAPPPLPDGLPKLPKPPLPYSSWFELRMFMGTLKNLPYEPQKLDYTLHKRYTPDSIIPGTNLLVELKGSFEKNDNGKYEAISKQNDVGFIFIFQQPKTEIAWKKPRKDGTRLSNEEWCEYHNKRGLPFYYCFEDTARTFFTSALFKSIRNSHAK